MISPSECLQLYTSIKLHFSNESYDFFKFKGKIKNPPKLSKRNDQHFFTRLSGKDDPAGLIIANVVADPQVWVGNLLHEKAKEIYLTWKKRQDALTYIFQEEFVKLALNFPNAFTYIAGNYPSALKMYLGKEVSIETLTVTNEVMSFLPNWDKQMTNDPVWKSIRLPLLKYRGFLDFDKEEFRRIILSILRSVNKIS